MKCAHPMSALARIDACQPMLGVAINAEYMCADAAIKIFVLSYIISILMHCHDVQVERDRPFYRRPFLPAQEHGSFNEDQEH